MKKIGKKVGQIVAMGACLYDGQTVAKVRKDASGLRGTWAPEIDCANRAEHASRRIPVAYDDFRKLWQALGAC